MSRTSYTLNTANNSLNTRNSTVYNPNSSPSRGPERRCSASLSGFAAVALASCTETRWLQTSRFCLLFFVWPRAHLRTSPTTWSTKILDGGYALLPTVGTHNTSGDRSFAVAGPRVWNSLLTHLRDEDITVHTTVSGVNSKRFYFNVASRAQWDFC